MLTPSLVTSQPHKAGTDNPAPARPHALADTSPRKSWVVAVQLSWLLGIVGADRFYLGYTRLGVLKLATLGGFGLWALVDLLLLLRGQIPDTEGRQLKD
jgi:TM2 domain